MPKADVLIVGASARAAAQSAVRAGLTPICADLFADEDLREIAEVVCIENYPHDLPALVRAIPPCPWMYTGALENHTEIISAISANRTLWGNSAESVAMARDPLVMADVLQAEGLRRANVRLEAERPPADGTWIVKPLRSAGGRGIRIWDARTAQSHALREPHYFQERLFGTAYSAVFVATPRHANLVGISRQLVGKPEFGASGYSYCGSIGPVSLDAGIEGEIERAGESLARSARLRGLFGIDLICDGRHAVAVEINPRYTASVEVFERAYGLALLDWHRRACGESQAFQEASGLDLSLSATLQSLRSQSPGKVIGKAVFFTTAAVLVPSLEEFATSRETGPRLELADRPSPGTSIAAGRPVCTILTEGKNADDCLTVLAESSAALERWLSDSGP